MERTVEKETRTAEPWRREPPRRGDPWREPGWPGQPPSPPEDRMMETVETDILVVGGGHAGTQCALAAAEGGARVAVVEKQPQLERLRYLGEQVGTFNSDFFISRGLGPYDLMEIIKEFCRCGAYRVNQRLISLYVRNSGEMLDHMISLVPPDSDLLAPDQCNIHQAYGKPKYPVVAGGQKTWAGTLQFRGSLRTDRSMPAKGESRSRISEFQHCAVKRSVELGARWYCGWEAAFLEQRDGRVAGLLAKNNKTGAHTRFLASRAVCLTTGNNSDMGHRLGVWAGGVMENNPRDNYVPFDVATVFGMTGFLTLNCRGQRFCDEGNPYNLSPQISRQPKGRVAAVFDSQWLEYAKRTGVHHGNPDFGMPAYLEQCTEDMSRVLSHGREGYGVRSLSTSEREQWLVWGANTLEELADYLGYEGGHAVEFVSSVRRYNELCHLGRDEDFGKDPELMIAIDKPPYYGALGMNLKTKQGSGMCPAGLLTDESMNLYDSGQEPIPGLYAAGNSLGDRYSLFYPTPCGGNMIGMAMTHGRVLGRILTGQAYKR